MWDPEEHMIQKFMGSMLMNPPHECSPQEAGYIFIYYWGKITGFYFSIKEH